MKYLAYLFLIMLLGCNWNTTTGQTNTFYIGSGAVVTATDSLAWSFDDMSLINQGSFDPDKSAFYFLGNQSSDIGLFGAELDHLYLQKNNNQSLRLKSFLLIVRSLNFSGTGNRFEVDQHRLSLSSLGNINGADENHFILTDSTGRFQKYELTNFTFPVGAALNSYTPITIIQNGTFDDISVRCLPHVYANGESGTSFSRKVVDNTWKIEEEIAGGSDLDIEVNWSASDELPGFDRTDCGIAKYESGTEWDLDPDLLSAATGSNLYNQTLDNTEPGLFVVSGDSLMDKVLLSLKIQLQGPANGTSMNDQLRAFSLIPTTTPYTGGKFTHSGRGGNEIIDESILNVTGDDAIIDWIFIWLKDPVDPSITYQTKSALLQKDGDIVDLDGVSPLELPGNEGDYHLGIGHRNHLSIRTATAQSLSETTSLNYDFTTSMTQAHGTNPMVDLGSTFAMWGGNTGLNNNVRATGPPTINDYSKILNTLGTPTNIIIGTYAPEDINMDGNIRATGPPVINDYSKLLNILGSPTNIIFEQF